LQTAPTLRAPTLKNKTLGYINREKPRWTRGWHGKGTAVGKKQFGTKEVYTPTESKLKSAYSAYSFAALKAPPKNSAMGEW
jgi:hypothetical protein